MWYPLDPLPFLNRYRRPLIVLVLGALVAFASIHSAYRPLPPLPAEHYESHLPDLTVPAVLTTWRYRDLARRVHGLLSRPIWSHDEALDMMYQGCDLRISKSNTPGHLRKMNEWKAYGPQEVVQQRVDIVKHLAELVEDGTDPLGRYAEYKHKRGIVYTGGNGVSVALCNSPVLLYS